MSKKNLNTTIRNLRRTYRKDDPMLGVAIGNAKRQFLAAVMRRWKLA